VVITIVKMKAIELQDKTREELESLLSEMKAKLVKVKFTVASRQHKNYKEISQIKRDIARIKTRLNQDEVK